MMRSPVRTLAAAAAVAATGLATAAAMVACGTTAPPASTSSTGPASTPYSYSYYRSMMRGYYGSSMMGGGSMMGGSGSFGSRGWMMSTTGYRWMTGAGGVPGWMHGGRLPHFMMATDAGTDPGTIMGRLWANAPGPRVRPAQAAWLGTQTPAGAIVTNTQRRITFSGTTVRLTVVASPAGGPDERFRSAGMVNPAIVVRTGARVTIQVINADSHAAHGMVITGSPARSSWMPMMTARPAFSGSALWFLGSPTPAGMHSGTLTFTASTPGTYRYLCPVPGHAQKGMTGTFTVTNTR
jgi:rusticyanin